jgi:SAM-dependent methyltransferase
VDALGDRLQHETRVRDCPVCAAPAGAARVVREERFDAARVGGFAFASRKSPELMHWRLVECRTCGVLFASPAPPPGLLADAYRDADYDSREEARYAGATYGTLVRRLVPRLPVDGGALDVGAGDGAFLEVLQAAGFMDVAGVEPSRAALHAADPRVRALIREGIFSARDFEPGSLRLVSCLQTIEHLPDPLAVLDDAHTLLRKGGALLVVCHDRTAPVNRLLGRRSPIYDVEHLQLFDPASLRGLLQRVGFTSIDIRPFANRYPLRYWMRLAPLPAGVKGRVISALDRVGLGALALTVPVGNLAAVGWKRS